MSDDFEEGGRETKVSREALDLFETIMSEFKDMTPMDEITKAAEQVAQLEAEAEELETALKAKKYVLNQLKTKTLPDALLKVNLGEMTIADGPYKGVKLKLSSFASGSLPKGEVERAAAIKLLEGYGAVDMIRNQLSMEFEKHQHNIALDMKARLEEEGFDVLMKSEIHAKTLGSLVLNRIESGLPVEPATLGIFVGKVVKLTWPKVKKPK